MQTISVPYECEEHERAILADWRRAYSAAVRTAYAAAATECVSADGTTFWTFTEEKALRHAVKARFAHDGTVDAWLLHCATRDGLAQRRRVPDGSMVFGGRDNLVRRSKNLSDREEWRRLRLRPLTSLGDKSYAGNRHFRLSDDGRTCVVRVLGRAVTLRLPAMQGTWGRLLPMVAQVAAAKEVNVTFRLDDKRLHVTFDEMDLRGLPAGQTLQQADDAVLAAKERRARGRPRGQGYVPPANPWTEQERPVHPDWRAPVPGRANRAVSIDLNPEWVGLSVVESDGTLPGTKVLAYRLVHLGLPADASNETVREALSAVVTEALSLARGWHASLVAVEAGLGKLRSGGPNRSLNRRINGWARNALLSILDRRCALLGLPVVRVWSAWSTVVGNTAFDIPDACAASAEIARRGLCARAGLGVLPEYDRELACRRWKDDAGVAAGCRAVNNWVEYGRVVKAAQVGVRRPHPPLGEGSLPRRGLGTVRGHAVGRLRLQGRPGRVAWPPPVQAGAANMRNERGHGSTLKSE